MSANLGSASTRSLSQIAGHLRVEFGYSTLTEISELYRAMAVDCIQKQIDRVLIVAGDGEPGGERALRDSLTMMILAGLPRNFRLALVVAAPDVARTYHLAQRDFTAAGVTTRLFESEDDATRWLTQVLD